MSQKDRHTQTHKSKETYKESKKIFFFLQRHEMTTTGPQSRSTINQLKQNTGQSKLAPSIGQCLHKQTASLLVLFCVCLFFHATENQNLLLMTFLYFITFSFPYFLFFLTALPLHLLGLTSVLPLPLSLMTLSL